MEHTRTTREPKQAIPTFAETIELLMREENRHVKFNWEIDTKWDVYQSVGNIQLHWVPAHRLPWPENAPNHLIAFLSLLPPFFQFPNPFALCSWARTFVNSPAYPNHRVDVKPNNDPDRLFNLMRSIIETQEKWEETLAPRILLGLWHPKFIEPATRILPTLRRAHIGMNPQIARRYFWNSCESFSIDFSSLSSADGEKFRKECKAANKKLLVWTVNRREEMIEASWLEKHWILTNDECRLRAGAWMLF
ncbi:hypothetical protein CTheo_3302 [Ceratobasidium theobromae]|uniref:Uncharacterized protein n=1 Tax=Ceratobasidium theobromae TaxID=1582974 RepID=A0A5N5QN74_9AGAM|nr:hypothetical protein CTheo_3302 [Ceratobasidium theobromae]